MNVRRFNWTIWAGFLLSLIAFLSYFAFFVWFPVTRDFPWANLLLFGFAAVLLVFGVWRAFAPARDPQASIAVLPRPHPTRSKIVSSILATLSVVVFATFIFVIFINGKRLPASHGAPQVGRAAPDFKLADTSGKLVSLSELLSAPIKGQAPKGVLLVFYRGYW